MKDMIRLSRKAGANTPVKFVKSDIGEFTLEVTTHHAREIQSRDFSRQRVNRTPKCERLARDHLCVIHRINEDSASNNRNRAIAVFIVS